MFIIIILIESGFLVVPSDAFIYMLIGLLARSLLECHTSFYVHSHAVRLRECRLLSLVCMYPL